jgi:hypothetical protein
MSRIWHRGGQNQAAEDCSKFRTIFLHHAKFTCINFEVHQNNAIPTTSWWHVAGHRVLVRICGAATAVLRTVLALNRRLFALLLRNNNKSAAILDEDATHNLLIIIR